MVARRRYKFGFAAATSIMSVGLLTAPCAVEAAASGPTLSITPSAVAPGQVVQFVYHMPLVPANFPLPNCQTIQLVSSVAPHPSGTTGVLAVTTVAGPGDVKAQGTIPAGATPGTYSVDAQACGITWASATFQVTMPMPSTGAGLDLGSVGFGAALLTGGSLLTCFSWRRQKRSLSA